MIVDSQTDPDFVGPPDHHESEDRYPADADQKTQRVEFSPPGPPNVGDRAN